MNNNGGGGGDGSGDGGGGDGVDDGGGGHSGADLWCNDGSANHTCVANLLELR